jgi:hypothetical protein
MAKGIFLFFLLVLASARAQFCDPELQTQQGDPNAYQERGDRCEGIYFQDVASSAISLTSFTTNYEALDTSKDTIELTWIQPASGVLQPQGDLHLRADSQLFKLYYRMDTYLDMSDMKFSWSAKILKNLELSKPDIGLAAWIPAELPIKKDRGTSQGVEQRTPGVERDVYLPLTISEFVTGPEDSAYSIMVMPSAELKGLSYRIATAYDGYAGEEIQEKTSLDGDYFPNGRPVEIPISLPSTATGVYYLEIEAVRTNEKKSHLEVWFYHHHD